MHLSTSVDLRSKTRLVGLDLLRLFAVLLVLGRHIPLPPESVRIPLRGFFEYWFRGGWVGVDLFFVLSGFLVAGLLFNEYQACGTISPWRFYVRRGWKIYPAFYVMIGVTLAYYAYRGVYLPKPAVLSELLFLQSYLPGLWNHTWSLAVEEHFYLLLPLVLVGLLRWNKKSVAPLRSILPLAGVVGALCLYWRIARWEAHPVFDNQTNLFPTHLRLDGLFFGVALSYLYHFHKPSFISLLKPWRGVLLIAGLLLLAPAFYWTFADPILFTVGFTMFYIGGGLLLVGVLLCDLPRDGFVGGVLKRLAKLGSYSYSIYLWHMPFLVWGVPLVQRMLGRPLGFSGAVVVYLSGSLVCGVVMAKCVEMPALKLRERWFPARSPER
ncbi:MAG: acyltransferase [Planctomycetia bacterium]|nr:acyltransferase [Planctomycetia bacterium]